ncbi:hypothetical protein [Halpernia frigidisoli]|nr:hypothetical protein [Halpernia frigidisoli]
MSSNKQQTSPKKEEITAIELSRYGGQLGYFGTLKFTKDSIIQTVLVGTKSDKVTKTGKKISKGDWQNISNSFRLEDFKKVKSGSSNMAFDGTDTKIKITTANTSDSIINGDQDKENFKKIEKLNQTLETFWTN